MKKSSRKSCLIPWVLLVALCLVFTSCVGAYAADSYYPGPGEDPEEPVVVVTPKPKPKPTPAPTPKPTEKPHPPRRTPEPEPEKEDPYYTLTVYYLYTDGSPAAVTFQEQFREGDSYQVVSPAIPGYHVSAGSYSGRMPGRNNSFVVWYYGEGLTVLEDYDTPLGLGNVVINIGDCYE